MSRRGARRLPVLEARLTFERLIGPLRAVAARHGYALAVHGTLARDIDLVAVPWVRQVSPARTLIEAMRDEMREVTGKSVFWIHDPKADPFDYTKRSPEPKPHGRLAWSLYIGGAPTYVDISVMATVVDARQEQLRRFAEDTGKGAIADWPAFAAWCETKGEVML